MDESVSLRDRLAMAALQAVTNGTVQPERAARERMARTAYAFADAMLEARSIEPAQLRNLIR